MDNKRKTPRVRTSAILSFKVQSTRLAGGTRVKDISEFGICIPSKSYFAVGSILEMEIRSYDLNEPIKVVAKVVRVANLKSSKFQFEVGLEFIDLSIPKKTLIQKYIEQIKAQGENQDISWLD